MRSRMNSRNDLTTAVIKRQMVIMPAISGMWYDENNRHKHFEPLATVPKYRRMGLVTIELAEGM